MTYDIIHVDKSPPPYSINFFPTKDRSSNTTNKHLHKLTNMYNNIYKDGPSVFDLLNIHFVHILGYYHRHN